jgi:hypothetical protein
VTESPYLQIHRLVNEVANGGSIPAGGRGAMFAAIDGLRRRSAPADHVGAAERIAVALHQFDWAVRDQDEARKVAACETLKGLGEDWLRSQLPLARH